MRLCWFCSHLIYCSGQHDWSEATPGHGLEMWCGKDHWELDIQNTEEELRTKLPMAKGCPDLVQNPEIEQ